MRPWIAALLLAGCASGAPAAGRAPDVEVRDLDGKAVPAASLWADRPVLLVFMTAW